MNKLTNPYYNTELYDRISLRPEQLNNDLYNNIKNNLIIKNEKKCCQYGYIYKINNIIEISDGIDIIENFDSKPVFNIKYNCILYYPKINNNIICKIELLNKQLIKAIHGPIICIIRLDTYEEIDNKIMINNKELKINDKIIINIENTNFFPNDNRIIVIGSMIGIPNESEIEKYFL
jgi:DNA-directed RNA polymerase subunit E'/Rpb7